LLSSEIFPFRIHQNRCRLGLRPRPHWGSLQRFPDLLADFKGAASRQEGNGGQGKERLGRGEKRGREGKREWGREGKEGKLVIVPWFLGG